MLNSLSKRRLKVVVKKLETACIGHAYPGISKYFRKTFSPKKYFLRKCLVYELNNKTKSI